MSAPKPGGHLPVIAVVALLALFVALPHDGSAQEPPWDIFTGNGLIDDLPVADGTVVEAWIRDVPVASTKTFGSQYQIYIEQPPGEFFNGQFIKFKLDGYEIDRQHGWDACTQAKVALYAYTDPQSGGHRKPDPDPDAVHAVRELQARRAELERERLKMSTNLEHQVANEIANVTSQWERAIKELRAEVERELQQIKRKFELERMQIPLGSGREALVRKLDLAIESVVQEKWADFESQSRLKRQYLRDDIIEIELTKDHELNEVYQRIYQVQDELHELMRETGVLFNFAPYTGSPDDFVDSCSAAPLNREERSPSPESPSPEIPSPGESGRSRGFFTNSISTDTNAFDRALDPTALAIIGILITFAATAVQLVRGN